MLEWLAHQDRPACTFPFVVHLELALPIMTMMAVMSQTIGIEVEGNQCFGLVCLMNE